ncbi:MULTISPECIES: tripartite tricarboxylate transporter TctB family protein [unclassified Sedimentibacter]|uniref:tripartite tricarboxylate transporter TctB family protein n=1 Tax=unclassified Sedimentibacter TaxID=2649220 RepID=UPI0027E1C124|nr:tripartite tricarboxylate transporter TctB family protein [Sedimentibacter sp. MB35-C1]WMJ76689.1 tripartite tricarboxylate transporter TctB family protein [Sedimentibacter sp. MB35-C1]
MSSKIKPGETVFLFMLLGIGTGAFIESINMYMNDPAPSSYGALPLFLSSIIVLFMIKIIFFESNKTVSESENFVLKEKFKLAVEYIFTKDILLMLLMLIGYCLLLVLGVGFELVTPIFLFTSMSYLMNGKYLQSLIFTVVVMAFILIIFNTIFQVILP